MLSAGKMSSKVEEIVDRRVDIQKSLSLCCRFESSHHPFTNSRRLMRQLRPIVGILCRVMDSVRDKLTLRDAIASQFIGHTLWVRRHVL